MTKREHLGTRGEIIVIVLLLAFCLIFGIGPWYMGGGLAWLGGPKRVYGHTFCDPAWASGCATIFAEEAAAQATAAVQLTPPAWWPWRYTSAPTNDEYWPASSAFSTEAARGHLITVGLLDFEAYPERYQGSRVIIAGTVLHVYSPTEFTIGALAGDEAYVVAPDPSYTKDIHEHEMVWLTGIAGGNCKADHPASALICAEEIRDLSH